MSDLVSLLRFDVVGEPTQITRVCRQAADEIERLNRRVRTLEAALSGIVLWEEDYAYASDIPQELIKTARVALKTVEG